jgi:hypothetical protein
MALAANVLDNVLALSLRQILRLRSPDRAHRCQADHRQDHDRQTRQFPSHFAARSFARGVVSDFVHCYLRQIK